MNLNVVISTTLNQLVIERGVAQPGSAHAWGACGRRFESSHPDQFMNISC